MRNTHERWSNTRKCVFGDTFMRHCSRKPATTSVGLCDVCAGPDIETLAIRGLLLPKTLPTRICAPNSYILESDEARANPTGKGPTV